MSLQIRRWFALVALFVGLSLAGAACQAATPALTGGSATATPAPPSTVVPTPEPVTLTLTCRCVREGVNQNLVIWMEDVVAPAFAEQMAAQGRQVSVQVLGFDGDDEAYKTLTRERLSGDSEADLIVLDGFWIPEFVTDGLLQPLDEVAGPEVAQWEGWTHISPGVRDLMGYQGKTYGLALGTDTRAIFYRRDLFEQAAIPTPWQPQSWQELLDTARTLKAQLPGVTPLQINAGTAMGEATTMQGYFMLLLGAGSHLYDFEQEKWIVRSPAILEALRFYQTVYGEEALGERALQLSPDGRNQSFAAFRDGAIAMLVESDYFWRAVLSPGSEWELVNRNEVVDWARMPAQQPGVGYRGQDFVTISGGTGVVLNPRTPHPQEAWALLAFMFSQEMLNEFQRLEPRMRVRSDVAVIGEPVLTDMGQTLLPLTTVRPTLPVYPRISEEVQRMTERVVSGEMSPEEAMEAYAAAVEALVGPENTLSVQ